MKNKDEEDNNKYWLLWFLLIGLQLAIFVAYS